MTGSILHCIDIYAKPYRLVKDGEKYKRSKVGGVATLIMGFLVMYLGVYFLFYKGNQDFDEINHIRRLQSQNNGTQTPSQTKTNAKLNEYYYSKENIWWKSYEGAPINRTEMNKPINAIRTGLGDVSLVFQSRAYQQEFEEKIIPQGPELKKAWVSSKFGNNEAIVEEYADFFHYKLSTLYWPGSKGESQDKAGIPSTTYIPKESLTFKSTKGGDYSLPELPITDNIFVYGDHQDRNISNMKAYTKFELKANMVAFYKKAYENMMSHVQELEDAGATVEWTDNAEPTPSTPLTFTEKLKDDMIKAFTQDKTKFDAKFY